MNAINETQRIVEWRALRTQYPTTFTWDGDEYTGRITDSMGFNLSPIEGGFLQEQEGVNLYCLQEDFTDGAPGEGDIVKLNGIGWRIARVTRIMSFGLVYELESPDRR